MKNGFIQITIKIIILFAIVFLLVITLILPIYLGIRYGQLPSIPEYWLQYLSIFLSCFSFGAVIFTIWLQFRESKKQQSQITKNFDFAQQNYDSQILDKIHYFMSDAMTDCRSGCWILWAQIKSDPSIKDELYNYFQKSITNDWGNENIAIKTFKSSLFNNYSCFIKLARYFNLISNYNFSPLTANALHYYYIFYRPFLKEMIHLYNTAYDSIKANERMTSSKEGWVYLVEKFDSIMKSHKLPLK